MTEYRVISDHAGFGLCHGVYEVREGGSREVARFYDEGEAQAYAQWRAGAKAQELRDRLGGLRAAVAEDAPFEARRRAGESLNPPTAVASPPLYGDDCGICRKQIGETESWVPDPQAEAFTRVHRECLAARG